MSSAWKWCVGIAGAVAAGVIAIFAVLFSRKASQTTGDILERESEEMLERARKDAEHDINVAIAERNAKWDDVQNENRRKVTDESSTMRLDDVVRKLSGE